jgi:superfamily II helicase
MGILDNLEAYLEKAEKTEKCHYCQSKAKYTDIAPIDESKYDIVGVCECHSFKGLSS